MHIPVAELGDKMPLEELMQWRLRLGEPRGSRRADYHAAQICRAIDRAVSAFAKGSHVPSLERYLLEFVRPETAAKANLQVVAMIFPGTIPDELLKE